MKILKTDLRNITYLRSLYFNSLPQFQELYLELMVSESDYYLFQYKNDSIGYAIVSSENKMIEFYVCDSYVRLTRFFFDRIVKDFHVCDILCKSFDTHLLHYCLLNSYTYSIVGLMYRDYVGFSIKKECDIIMKRSSLSSFDLLWNQDNSITELFETSHQLAQFIESEHVLEFYKNGNLIGCGTVIKVHPDWSFCDLGVWVNPVYRGCSYGAQILIQLREYALNNKFTPSCGCFIDNLPSQKVIEKSGYVSHFSLLKFKTK